MNRMHKVEMLVHYYYISIAHEQLQYRIILLEAMGPFTEQPSASHEEHVECHAEHLS